MEANESIDALVLRIAWPLTGAAALALLLCLLLALAEASLAALTGAAAWRWSPAPQVVRRLAFAACGLTLTMPLANTAASADRLPAPHATCPPACAGRLDGLRLPDLPVRARAETIRVAPGDCLWTLALARLGRRADDVDVARLVHTLYRINRTRIGPDPDLIFPDTQLTVPEAPR